MQTHNHLVRKQTLSHLVKFTMPGLILENKGMRAV